MRLDATLIEDTIAHTMKEHRGRVGVHFSGDEQAFYRTTRKYTTVQEVTAATNQGW